MKIAAIVCPNGLGHFKRVLSIFQVLTKQTTAHFDLDVFCCRWQYEALLDDYLFSDFLQEKVNPVFAMEVCGVRWQKETHAYTSNSLMDWTGYINALYRLNKYDKVLSDNLVQILQLRPDTVMVGSFLWSDVFSYAFPGIPVIQQFVSLEQDLLNEHRPPMLVNKELVMPGVVNQTDAKPVDWMCNEQKLQASTQNELDKDKPLHVGLFGGATDTQRNAIQQFASSLSDQGHYRIFMRKEDILPMIQASPFDFRPESWSSLDVAVIRTGVGTITDCVSYNIPCMTLVENKNLEMIHNAEQLERLGIGRRIDVFQSDALQVFTNYLESDAYMRARENIRQQPKDGLKQATAFLAQHWELTS